MNDKTKPDMLLWIDVETTALSPAHGQLLEVGMILTTMTGERLKGVDVHDEWRWVIRHDSIRLTPKTSYAVSMLHTANHLIDETFDGNSVTETRAASEMLTVLNALADRYVLHPAGTNVAFDIEWVMRGLGLNLTQLHYRCMDMTTLRMLMKQVCLGAYSTPDTDHRVMTCLNRDIQEYKTILHKITALAEGDTK